MRHAGVVPALAWCLAWGVQAGEPAGTANPLPNPGFEDAAQHWAIGDAISQVIPEAAHSGKLGLRIGADSYTPGGSSVTSARFPVTPGQDVTATFQARASADCAGVYLSFLTAAGRMIKDPATKGGLPMAGIRKSGEAWQPYALQAKAPEGAAWVALWIHSFSGAIGKADLDDVAIGGIAAGAAWVDSPVPRRATALPAVSATNMPSRATPPIIVLKFDDVKQVNGQAHAAWRKLADYLAGREIKAGFGVICETLQDATPAYATWIRDLHEAGRVEFWFHGWDHATHAVNGEAFNEFKNRSYEEQKERLDRSQKLAQAKLGFAFRTFGPPGGVGSGSFDDATLRVMADDPFIKVWLYPQPLDAPGKALDAAGKVTILDRVWAVNLESAVGVPDYNRFLAGYAANLERPYFVLQGHPAAWSPERFAEFTRIVDFLVSQKAVFMTPCECAAAIKTKGR